jgi:hypothetical protein
VLSCKLLQEWLAAFGCLQLLQEQTACRLWQLASCALQGMFFVASSLRGAGTVVVAQGWLICLHLPPFHGVVAVQQRGFSELG